MEYILERRKNILQFVQFYHKSRSGLKKNKKIFIMENQSRPGDIIRNTERHGGQSQEIIQGCHRFSTWNGAGGLAAA
ncbi:MAG TPA: hypothetical protein DIU00_09520 [Phycisphaerales bacterium]|nr:hypothetical protein [Phycisphaerales bacterium]